MTGLIRAGLDNFQWLVFKVFALVFTVYQFQLVDHGTGSVFCLIERQLRHRSIPPDSAVRSKSEPSASESTTEIPVWSRWEPPMSATMQNEQSQSERIR